MAITSIKRDFVGEPHIVRIITTDNLATITTSGYVTAQKANIEALNKGEWEWVVGEPIVISFSDGEGFFTYAPNTASFLAETDPGSLGETLLTGRIFVGSLLNIATGVPMSGAVEIDNSGETILTPESVSSATLADGLIRHVQVDVDLSTFMGSFTASAELVAAPGANKKLMFHRASVWIDYGGTVLANGGAVQIQYGNTAEAGGTAASGTQAASAFIAAEADTSLSFTPVDTTLVDSATLNEGLYLATATGDFTGGTGSAYKVDVWYSVVDVA